MDHRQSGVSPGLLKMVEAIRSQARSSGIGRWWEVQIDELKKAKDQRPFQPFRIRMADGTEIEIKHPDAAEIKRRQGFRTSGRRLIRTVDLTLIRGAL